MEKCDWRRKAGLIFVCFKYGQSAKFRQKFVDIPQGCAVLIFCGWYIGKVMKHREKKVLTEIPIGTHKVELECTVKRANYMLIQ